MPPGGVDTPWVLQGGKYFWENGGDTKPSTQERAKEQKEHGGTGSIIKGMRLFALNETCQSHYAFSGDFLGGTEKLKRQKGLDLGLNPQRKHCDVRKWGQEGSECPAAGAKNYSTSENIATGDPQEA